MNRVLADTAATEALGSALARTLVRRGAAVIYLEGDLGAGKTTLARGFLRALGVQGTIRSPTYTLMEPYRAGSVDILHMDLYRLNDPLELHNLGLADYPPDRSFWLLEWPQRGLGVLPKFDIEVRLSQEGLRRRVQITGLTAEEESEISTQRP